MAELLLASNNAGKIREVKALLVGLEIEILTPASIGLELQVDEVGSSYAENAAIKANAYARATGLLTMADDSGLEVKALGGLPGVHSARISRIPDATDRDRRSYLLTLLQEHERPWTACFVCTVAVVKIPDDIFHAQGMCEGEIIPDERGQGGFGYDPLFYIPELKLTMAELSMDEKNQFSHRAMAIKKALPNVKMLLSG